jgi:hypothetical protein
LHLYPVLKYSTRKIDKLAIVAVIIGFYNNNSYTTTATAAAAAVNLTTANRSIEIVVSNIW